MTDLYTGAMGIISNMLNLDVRSNNIANATTNGFKFDQATFKVFEENHLRSKKEDSNNRIGEYNDEVFIDNISTNFTPGNFQSTSSPLDFALVDKNPKMETSFFSIKKGDNDYLTRNGRFMLDVNRHVSTANGGQVVDENGKPIKIPQNIEFSVKNDGTIINNRTNEKIAKMKVVSVASDDLGLLSKEYGGYYRVRTFDELVKNFGNIQSVIDEYDNDITLRKVFGSKERLENIKNSGQVNILSESAGTVQPNAIEMSNVEMQNEMIKLIEAQKNVQASQKVFSTMDKVLEKAANNLGR